MNRPLTCESILIIAMDFSHTFSVHGLACELYSHLRPIDKLALRLTGIQNSLFRTPLDWTNIIVNRLRGKIRDDPNVFLERLKSADNHISGSFLLQVLYDEEWKDSDLDIFFTTTNIVRYGNPISEFSAIKYLTHMSYPKKTSDDPYKVDTVVDFSDQLFTLKEDVTRTKRYGMTPFESTKYKHSRYPLILNFIHMRDVKVKYGIKWYIDHLFDFSCCKNTFFDGCLKICDLESIIHREIHLSEIDTKLTNSHIDKMREHHAIYNSHNRDVSSFVSDTCKVAHATTQRRIEKYRARGFTSEIERPLSECMNT